MTRARLFALAGSSVFLVLVTACGGPSGQPEVPSLGTSGAPSTTTGSAAPGDVVKQLTQYANCMRQHGVDVPGPQVNGASGAAVVGASPGGDSDAAKAANAACARLLPAGGTPGTVDPQAMDALRQQAKCLRDHGVKIDDPTAQQPYLSLAGVNSDDPATVAAIKTCAPGLAGGSGGAPVTGTTR